MSIAINPGLILAAYLIGINVFSLILMINDKSRATVEKQRIPEAYFFLFAALFGGTGVLAGMIFFRHKSRKWYFLLGMPLIIIQNILSFLYLIEKNFVKLNF